MPLLPHWTEIARSLGISGERLEYIAANNDIFFRPTVNKYVKGKKRQLDRPYSPHKQILRNLSRLLNKTTPVHPNAHCGVPNKSRFKAVRKHCGRNAYITRDFSDCYPSISQSVLYDELIHHSPDHKTARILSQLFTVRGRLAQGSPVSSFALNIYLYRLDSEVTYQVQRFGGRYSRYGDDMLVSLDDLGAVATTQRILAVATCTYTNLSFNLKKLEKIGLQLTDDEVLALGLDIRSAMGPRIPTATQQATLRRVQRYVCSAKSVNWDSIEGIAKIRRSLMGVVCDFRQAQFSNARVIEMQLALGDRIVQRKLSKLGLAPSKHKWWVKRKRKNEPKRLSHAWQKITMAALQRAA